jgi:hypothetical protein
MTPQTKRDALMATYQDLLEDLAMLERNQRNTTLSPTDRQALDREWDDCMREITQMEALLEQMDWEAAQQAEDDRPDCSRCAGCAYCEDSAPGYDEGDEI